MNPCQQPAEEIAERPGKPPLRLRTPLLAAPLFLSIACAACSGKPPAGTSRIEIGPSMRIPPQPSEDGRYATVKIVPIPGRFALDGDLSEWGDLTTETPLPSPPPPLPSVAEGHPGSHPPPLPIQGQVTARILPASNVAVALGPGGATIAARLRFQAEGGVWLGLLFDDPMLPELGTITPDGEFRPLSCDLHPDGTPLDDREATDCHALRDRRAAEQEVYSRRFRRTYWLDRNGVRALGDDDTLTYVPGSQVVFQSAPRGTTIEATLPARALPRTGQSTVTSAGAIVHVAPEAPTLRFTAAEHRRFDLMEPVAFEPHGKLRAGVLESAPERPYSGYTASYQPGDDLEVEEVDYAGTDAMKLRVLHSLLYARDSMFGDVEIGYSTVGGTSVVTFRNGEYVDMGPLAGAFQGSAKVGEEMHFFSLVQTKIGAAPGEVNVRWECVAVMKSGGVRFDLVAGTEETTRWVQAISFSAKDFSSFGIAGKLADGPEAGSTATWTYDSPSQTYVVKVTEGLSAAAAPAAPKNKAPGKNKAPPPGPGKKKP